MTESIFFLSDTHFKYHNIDDVERKKRNRFLDFLRMIEGAGRLYLLGDLFDFWFEYNSVVPRYYQDILYGLATLRKSGTGIYLAGGNHDHWFGSYLPESLGFTILPITTTHELHGRTVMMTHGDTFLPGDYAYKILKTTIRSRAFVALTRLIHPDILYSVARQFSRASKEITQRKTERFAKAMCLKAQDSFFRWGNDVFIMGHIHYPCLERFGERVFVILGDWEYHYSYLRLEGGEFSLGYYRPGEKTLIEKR